MAAAAWVAATLLDPAAADAIVFPPHTFRVAIFRGGRRVRGQVAVACRQAELNVHQLELVLQLVEARPSYHPAIVRAKEQERVLRKNRPLEPNHHAVKQEPSREGNLLSCLQKAAVTFSAPRPGLVLALA